MQLTETKKRKEKEKALHSYFITNNTTCLAKKNHIT